jgi:hypothetical protein
MNVDVVYTLTEISRALNIEYRRLRDPAKIKDIVPYGYRSNGRGFYKLEQFDGIGAGKRAELVSLTLVIKADIEKLKSRSAELAKQLGKSDHKL